MGINKRSRSATAAASALVLALCLSTSVWAEQHGGTDGDSSSDDANLVCSFCGKSYKEVTKLIAGPSVYICDECIESSQEIIADESPASEESSGDENPAEGETAAEEEAVAEEVVAEEPVAAPEAASASAESEAPAAAAAVKPAKLSPPTVGYNGGFFVGSPDGAFKLAINGRLQARLVFESLDGDPRENQSQFSLPRVRLKLSGHAFSERIAFALEFDFGKGGVRLKDGYAEFKILDRWLFVEVGQFKRPFSRQQLSSSAKQQFVDRAITDAYFKGGRDLGVMLHSHKMKAPIEYAVGLFNGTGDKGLLSGDVVVDPYTGEGGIESGTVSNVPDLMDPMLVARLGWHTKDFDGYSESDTNHSDFGFAIGGGVVLDFDADNDDDSAVRAEVDYALKFKGLSSSGAFYLATAQAGLEFSDQAWDAVGLHVQVGYAIKGVVEPMVRYARILPNGYYNDSQEIRGGFSVFFHGHNLKWSTDVGILTDGVAGLDDAVDVQVRSQVQLAF